jgi:hypothetical protein
MWPEYDLAPDTLISQSISLVLGPSTFCAHELPAQVLQDSQMLPRQIRSGVAGSTNEAVNIPCFRGGF